MFHSPKATDSDTERYLLFTAVVGLLAEASADEPVMLIFDDMQWADSGSLLLLRHLATTDLPMRVLLLATLRDHELPNAKELRDTVGALWRQPPGLATGARRPESRGRGVLHGSRRWAQA